MEPAEPLSPSPFAHEKVTPWKILLPVVIIAVTAGAVWSIVNSKPEVVAKAPEEHVAVVDVLAVQPQTVTLSVASQGTVRPRVQTQLTAEVSGRVEEVAPNFRPGGAIRKGEVLVRIDPVNYEAALATAQANLAQAKFALAQEEALAEQAKADWQDLGRGEPTDLALRVPNLEQATAGVASAQAQLKRAGHDLERTVVRAPYDGRVTAQSVDLGQYVNGNTGAVLGVLYATDTAEIYLPVDADELTRLDLTASADQEEQAAPPVTLSASFGGKNYTWEGRIIRTGAAFDERTRLLDLVAAVDDPLAADPAQPGRPVLKPGLFVRAEIAGRQVEGCYILPRPALRENNTVLVATPEGTLARRQVSVLQADIARAVIDGGLEPGDLVITSPIEYVVEGMKVEVPAHD